MPRVILLLLLLQLSCWSGIGNSRPLLTRVIQTCQSSGCPAEPAHVSRDAKNSPFVFCGDRKSNSANTNCRDGYDSSLNDSEFDYIYDFNSLYAYDNTFYESLAWQAPERAAFFAHALRHKPSKVAINLPLNQQKWSLGVIWAIRKLGVEVTEFVYNSVRNTDKDKTLLDNRPRSSSKWIGLKQTCQSVCRPCFRAMTLCGYLYDPLHKSVPFAINISEKENILSYAGPKLSCNDVDPRLRATKDIVVRNISNIHESGVLHSIRRENYDSSNAQQKVNCEHILIIIREGSDRAFIYPEVDSHKRHGSGKKLFYKKDYRIIEAFQKRFGAGNIEIYFGNSTTEELLQMFSNACAVVGAHGAAGANVVFLQPYTYMLELSTHLIDMHIDKSHPNTTIDYKSNLLGGIGTGVTWDVYKVGWEKIYPPFKEKLLENYEHPHSRIAIHNHVNWNSNFVLDDRDYASVVQLTCVNIKGLSNKFSSC